MNTDIASLIPHRPPMQWLTALTACDEKSASATACFGENDFPVVGGKVLEVALVECVAQTVAAALGSRKQSGGEGKAGLGMLVAVSGFKIFFRPAAGQVLHIEVRERRRLGPMLMLHADITCDGQTVAAGDLSVYA